MIKSASIAENSLLRYAALNAEKLVEQKNLLMDVLPAVMQLDQVPGKKDRMEQKIFLD